MPHGHCESCTCGSDLVATTILREYGGAIRGDWGDIDGRSVKRVLEEIADVIEGKKPSPSLEVWRVDLSLCPSGEGHWRRHCTPRTTLYKGTENEYTFGCGNEPSEW